MDTLTEDYFNETAILAHLRESKLKYESETNRKKRPHFERRYRNDLNCYQNGLLNQYPVETDKPGIFHYKPAYRALSTGRISQIGGGLQSCTREMKAAAYSGIDEKLNNYDISATQANILLQELIKAGLEKSWLWQYLDTDINHPVCREGGMLG